MSGIDDLPKRRLTDKKVEMHGKNTLVQYLVKIGLRKIPMFSDGAVFEPGEFPLAGVETSGSVLFADLPGYSRIAAEVTPVQCTYLVNHFFSWFEAEMRGLGGIVDKFIGDEIMVVFLESQCGADPSRAALTAAQTMLESDAYNFAPKIGVASGPLFIACVGTRHSRSVTAIGNTVNIAARLVGDIQHPHTIRVGVESLPLVKALFTTSTSRWSISEPFGFKAKNVGVLEVVDISRQTEWVPTFDYWEDAKKAEKLAREHGAIVVDRGQMRQDA